MFNIGDIVKATRYIKRKDNKSLLNKGELAKIKLVFETENSQIVDIEIQGRLPMTDIVCVKNDKQPLENVN